MRRRAASSGLLGGVVSKTNHQKSDEGPVAVVMKEGGKKVKDPSFSKYTEKMKEKKRNGYTGKSRGR